MKRAFSMLLAVLLVITSLSSVYAKGNGNGNGKGNSSYYYEDDQNEQWNSLDYLKKQFKIFHKDKEKRKEILKKISELKKNDKKNVINVYVEGEEVSSEVPPVIKDGRILLPLAPITKALGAELKWDAKNRTITVTKDGTVIVIKLDSSTITVNGKEIKLETAAVSINNRVFVPISLIRQILKQNVDIDDDSDSVIIDDENVITVNDSVTGSGNNQFDFTGDWSYGDDEGCYNDDNHWSTDEDAYYRVRFYGTQIKLYAAKDASHGIAAVSIDGGKEKNIDLYAKERTENVLVYTSPVLKNGQHVLKVRVTGDKNSEAENYYVTADRVEIIGNEEDEEEETIVSFNDSETGSGVGQFKFVGDWTYKTQSGAFMNDIHYSNDTNDYYQVKFNGTRIELYGAKAPNYGKATITIDGDDETKVDLYSSDRKDNVLLYTSPVLTDGQHTLKVRVSGTKNSSSSGYYVSADRVEVTDEDTAEEDEDISDSIINDDVTGTDAGEFDYSGDWSYTYQAGPYMNDYHWSKSTDSYADIKFDGRQIMLYGSKDPSYGIAAISVDGVIETNVDYYAAEHSDNVLIYKSPILADGQHTLKINVTGTKNSKSTNYQVVVDKVKVVGDDSTDTTDTSNLALDKTVVASSVDDSSRDAEKAVDGKSDTCWYSQYSDDEWIYVDLGAEKDISKVKLYWETAYGKAYGIYVSDDAEDWTKVYSTESGNGGTDDIDFTTVSARYVKLLGEDRATQWGYSLKEFEVYR